MLLHEYLCSDHLSLKVQGQRQTCALHPFEKGALFQTLSNREKLDALICTEGKLTEVSL